MPLSRAQIVRLKVLDECLRSRHHYHTMEELMEKCANRLYESQDGRISGVSKRTIQEDLRLIRETLANGQGGRIVQDRANHTYRYEDPEFSIFDMPLTGKDVAALTEAMDILRHFQIFSQLAPAADAISKLQEHISVSVEKRPSAIDLERNDRLKGLGLISGLYDAVRERHALVITYRSFRARVASRMAVSPYLLKEFRNRWFLLCFRRSDDEARYGRGRVATLAIDRMEAVERDREREFVEPQGFDPAHFFDDAVGVTKRVGDHAERVVLRFNANSAPYVLTKPLHPSQRVVREMADHSVEVELTVVVNFELEREIIGNAETCEVLCPEGLRQDVARKLRLASLIYELGSGSDSGNDSV